MPSMLLVKRQPKNGSFSSKVSLSSGGCFAMRLLAFLVRGYYFSHEAKQPSLPLYAGDSVVAFHCQRLQLSIICSFLFRSVFSPGCVWDDCACTAPQQP